MKNYEKYKDKIRGYEFNTDGGYFCDEFIIPYILKKDNCDGIGCEHCHILQIIWLLEDYEEPKEEPKEPEIDWSKIKVDTPVLVKDKENEEWKKRHFAKYEFGRVHVWNNGSTSWSACHMYDYKYAKLPENERKPEIDWTKIKVDTPILVRDSEDSKWLERYFAKYEDGLVYAWLGENTSYDTCNAAKWKHAKLAESEENI